MYKIQIIHNLIKKHTRTIGFCVLHQTDFLYVSAGVCYKTLLDP